MTIVAIHQPNYLPWLGYFDKLARADRFVFLDDAQFTKNSYINRTRVAAGGAARWLTIPVQVHLGDPIASVRPATTDWRRRHLDALKQFYRAAPAFDTVWSRIEAIYAGIPDSGLAAINMHLIGCIADLLGLKTPRLLSSDLGLDELKGSERLIAICQHIAPGGTYLSGRGGVKYQDEAAFDAAGLALQYNDFDHPEYSQDGAFIAGLSMLDPLFRIGPEATAELIGGGSRP
ncbi:MAG TPA: WbqC family protein [Alphaproteobacteria bacterium]|nr:WbqC family protein [Alphaproteobacteria bacterium]